MKQSIVGSVLAVAAFAGGMALIFSGRRPARRAAAPSGRREVHGARPRQGRQGQQGHREVRHRRRRSSRWWSAPATRASANAVVSVPGAKGAKPRPRAVLDQKGCKFVPAHGGDAAGRGRDQELGRHPAQHPHVLHGESGHQQGPAEVQEDDDGEAREAGVREGHVRRAQLDARVGGVVPENPAGGHRRQGGVVKIENVPPASRRSRCGTRRSASRRRKSRSRPGRSPRSASR